MLRYVIAVEYLSDYRLALTFDDKTVREIDLAPWLDGEIFVPLREIAYFKTVHVNHDIDTIAWENGADFAPEFLYENSKAISLAANAA